MKVLTALLGLSISCFLYNCTDNLNEEVYNNEPAQLTGCICEAPQSTVPSPSIVPTHLPAGSQILVNASGSLELSNEILTYQNNRWGTRFPLRWTYKKEETNLTALYPAYADSRYDTDRLYANKELTDVLYTKDKFRTGTPIQLQFKHLFAQLTLQLSPKLQAQLKQLDVTCPHTVHEINPVSGEVTLALETPHTTTCQPHATDNRYTIIVPAGRPTTFNIRLQTADQTYETKLSLKQVDSGHVYVYTLQDKGNTPGIATVEDWITFVHLINTPSETSYNGKTLQDFGETINEVTTYYLLNDLDFHGVEPSIELSVSASKNGKNGFNDIFDGQGHTLSNMTLLPGKGGAGVFIAIYSTGCVKNLHLKNCTTSINAKNKSFKSGVGILSGINIGTILNCSVKDSQLTADMNNESSPIGIIAGNCTGMIANCSVENVELKSKQAHLKQPAGGLVGFLQKGNILNCYVSHITINNTNYYAGGLCGSILAGTLKNCYIHQASVKSKAGLLAGTAEGECNIEQNYHEKNSKIKVFYNNTKIKGSTPYDTEFRISSKLPVWNCLNQWIEEYGNESYPQFTFNHWQAGETDQPAVFEN